ncbi:MAG: hypothetical protein A2Y81_01745 [Nitrospirae bacterium RBG_13_43_8]|nr:MAG: hypothetical protein A2Y81_01745 [Nitrospirae bacterium RBG_13_43_8]
MGSVKPAESALLFVSTLYRDSDVFEQSKEILENSFGDTLYISPPLPWDYSSYYRNEIGEQLFRQIIFFKNIVDPGLLADIKLKTNEFESALSLDGRRQINLDPGYLTLAKVVLASTKNYAHRLYLGKGIYGEITLSYKDETYSPHIFTYRDYQDKSHIDIFMNARAMLKKISG